MKFEVSTFPVAQYDEILARGLSNGLGSREIWNSETEQHEPGQVCIEAAICQALGLPHGDDPGCVASAVRDFKIALNDKNWSSPTARAAGLRNLGLAQLGSLRVVDDTEFTQLLAKKTISILIPMLFRQIFPNNVELLIAVDRCEKEGSKESAYAAANAVFAANAANATNAAVFAANAANAAAYAAYAAANAANAAANAANAANAAAYAAANAYLILSANLALETLRELNSPGIALLNQTVTQKENRL